MILFLHGDAAVHHGKVEKWCVDMVCVDLDLI